MVIELFAGTGRFAHAMGAHRPTLIWDVLFGEKYDLTVKANQRLILGWIKCGWVAAVWLGTPCNSFSRARNQPGGPPALRTGEFPHGLSALRPCDQAAVKLGNCLAMFSAQVVTLCAHLLIPATIENPATSWLWCTRWMKALLRRRDVSFGCSEFCMWQKFPFRKSTGFLHTGVDLSRVFARRCLGARRGFCASTDCPHKALSGTDDSGKFWTKIAEPYLRALCRELASAFDAAIANRRYQIIKLTFDKIAAF